jgi:hypothetical protein
MWIETCPRILSHVNRNTQRAVVEPHAVFPSGISDFERHWGRCFGLLRQKNPIVRVRGRSVECRRRYPRQTKQQRQHREKRGKQAEAEARAVHAARDSSSGRLKEEATFTRRARASAFSPGGRLRHPNERVNAWSCLLQRKWTGHLESSAMPPKIPGLGAEPHGV